MRLNEINKINLSNINLNNLDLKNIDDSYKIYEDNTYNKMISATTTGGQSWTYYSYSRTFSSGGTGDELSNWYPIKIDSVKNRIITCGQCENSVESDDKFCKHCGYNLNKPVENKGKKRKLNIVTNVEI